MKVIYETYRRHRNNSSSNQKNCNNKLQKKNGRIEICHPNNNSEQLSSNDITNNHDEPDEDLHHPTTQLSYTVDNCRHIISKDSLVTNKELGTGEFGVVQQGVWTNENGQRIQVAIKCLSPARLGNNRIEFLKEATIMHSISHEHIVTLYGVVLEPSLKLVTELAPLRSLLECLKEPTLMLHFPLTSLCAFAAQIADGMAYLEMKRLIHRDLAARNILVFSKTKVKISDFGLSRALGVGKDYYQSNFNVNLKLPIAWCAPECINYLKFTSQSDVWAYGVTLWEMFSFGFQPWAALTGQQILESIDEPNYQRLEKPECCPNEYYQLMLKCWTHEPNCRPKFSDIVNILPDCKPELLQAIRDNSDIILNQKDFLAYKSGDIVTVVEKLHDSNQESLWKGVTNDRKTGLFNPSDFVTYLGQNLPSSSSAKSSSPSFVHSIFNGSHASNHSNGHDYQQSSQNHHHSSLASTITSTVLQSSKFLRGFLESKTNNHHNQNNNSQRLSPHSNRKHGRLRPEMISKPQGDVKHTGHVGVDGVQFGDIGFLNNDNDRYQNINSASQNLSNKSESGLKTSSRKNNKAINLSFNHEYQEISDEEGSKPIESPPFEVLDFGPSLMEEVFRELDHIKPDFNNEAADCETAINENSINVKNEVREMNLKICKESNNLRKKHISVRPISEAEQNELDSAIAMAKDIANRTILEDDLDLTKSNDSPRTPNSPSKRIFSFKFPPHRSPKTERRTFSEETESVPSIIESISPAAKEAYTSLIEKGVTNSCSTSDKVCQDMDYVQAAHNSINNNTIDETENNPLRMLRTAGISQVLRPKIRGNRSFSQPRLPTTSQTAVLARVASSRSPLGLIPNLVLEDQNATIQNQQSTSSTTNNIMNGCGNAGNALPLPPRDRSRPLIQLKTHQRRHPLVIPNDLTQVNDQISVGKVKNYDDFGFDSLTSHHRHIPVLKQVSCPQAPATFLSGYNKIANGNNSQENEKIPLPQLKQNPPLLSSDLTESLESEFQKALDNMKISNGFTNNNESLVENHDLSYKDDKKNTNDHEANVQHQLDTNQSNFSQKLSTNQNNSTYNPQKNNNINDFLSHNGNLRENSVNNSSNTDRMAVKHQNEAQNSIWNGFSSSVSKHSNVINSFSSSKNRSIDSDEVRVMQKVLVNEVDLTAEECAKLLDSTEWDIHKAIKCVRLRQQLRNHNINIDCDWSQMLSQFKWNIRQASNYLIATHAVPEDTTEV